MSPPHLDSDCLCWRAARHAARGAHRGCRLVKVIPKKTDLSPAGLGIMIVPTTQGLRVPKNPPGQVTHAMTRHAMLLRHLGIMEMNNGPVFEGFYALRFR
jgi:hypothetical protein